MNDLFGVSDDVLRTQLRARNVMKREVRLFLAAIVLGMVVYYVFSFPSLLGLFVLISYLVILRTLMVWYQSRFLARFGLTCPFCDKPLATGARYLKGPTHNCPHCGRQALAPIRQLVEFEKRHS